MLIYLISSEILSGREPSANKIRSIPYITPVACSVDWWLDVALEAWLAN
jgi:hypothetical protein